jgi:phage terminase large subunit
MWDMAGRHGMVLCGRQFQNSLEDSSLEEIKAAIREHEWLEPWFDIGERYVRTKSGRIHYSFTGLDRSIDSIKSKSRILLCWVDEAEPVTEEAWTKLIPTLREEDSELWVTWNPESKRSPTHLRFRESRPDPRVKIAEINWKDNPWFPQVLERTRQRDLRDRPEAYSHIWEGDFAEVFEGAYYTQQLIEAREDGRITDVAYDPSIPCYTAMDLGIGDSTALWWFQVVGKEVRFLDYYEAHGQSLAHYADVIERKPYKVETHFVPHDAKVRELGTGRTRVETMRGLGLQPRLVPLHKVEDGINAVRAGFKTFWFDRTRCDYGLDALKQYRTEYKEDRATFNLKPLHNWASHGADAFRYAAMAWRELQPEPPANDVLKEMLRPPTFDDLMEELEYEDSY